MAAMRKQHVNIGAGELRLVREAGRYLLLQGESAIDVTPVMGPINNPMGTVALRLRVSSAGRLSVHGAAEPAAVEPEPAAV